ncbi:MAG: aminoacyl-tRNA hydrolase [Chthoniobacterales bacterium]
MAAESLPIRLVAGLGNPGAEYARTRHNIGFAVLDRLAADWRLKWERNAKWEALWAKGEGVLLVKPLTFMNHSGFAVSAVAQFYKIVAAETFVVLDDIALELGRLRIRLQGSSGGQNGLESVLMHFGTDQVPRLRVGIGAPPSAGAVDYVLGRFFEEELPTVEKTVVRASEAVKCAIDKGVLSAMNTFNKFPEP